MAQEKYLVTYDHLFVDGVEIPEVIESPELSRTIDTVDVTNLANYRQKVATNIRSLEGLEFTFNDMKNTSSLIVPRLYFDKWFTQGGERRVQIVRTDADDDPYNVNSILFKIDLGKCQLASDNKGGTSKTSPVAGTYKVTILPTAMDEVSVV